MTICSCGNLRKIPGLGLLATLFVLAPQLSAQVDSCNPTLVLAGAGGPTFQVGDTIDETATLGFGASVNATTGEISTYTHFLDCVNDGSPPLLPCVDEGAVKSFDSFVSTTCQNAADAAITWSCMEAGNTVTCTATNGPVVLALPGETCDIVLRLNIDSLSGNGADTTPLAIEQAGSFDGTCRPNNLSNTATSTLAVPLAVDCSVDLQKEVTCDGTENWVEDCVGWTAQPDPTQGGPIPAEPVMVQYTASNTGTAELRNCMVTDSNTAVLGGAQSLPDIPMSGEESFIDNDQDCSDSLDDLEPNTAMVVCDCFFDGVDTGQNASDEDGANFECQQPGMQVSKDCTDPNVETGENDVAITVTNSADATLINCTADDNIHLDDPSCPADGTPTPVALQVDSGSLAAIVPAGVVELSNVNPIGPLTAAACNQVSVTCEIQDSGGKTITNTSDDLCNPPQGEGCLTRTPGFWGTHPHVTGTFLPLEVCGISLDTTDANMPGSATEDMCGTGGPDFNPNSTSPQQLQLIRQCTAAALNIAATQSGEGDCEAQVEGLTARMAECCGADSLCDSGASPSDISGSGCIEFLDAFNNLDDTLDPFGPFMSPGPANPEECQEANGNGFVNPGRDLGPRK